jgi:predicted DNA binding CopG/RHH family protein
MGGSGKGKPAARRVARPSSLGDAVIALDAEDIALARLQAQLRKREAVRSQTAPAASAPRRVTLRLPELLIERLRARARRDGTTLSGLAGKAMEHFLRSA